MNSVALGATLTSSNDPSAWFVFYKDDNGIAAVDLTTAHPRIGYGGFEAVLGFEDTKPETEKIVLLGGPERPDDALLILHDTASTSAESNRIDDHFSFQAYTYVLVPGKLPMITTPDNTPAKIRLKPHADFLIVMGYRTWTQAALEKELSAGDWLCLPAPSNLLTIPRNERREKILLSVN